MMPHHQQMSNKTENEKDEQQLTTTGSE